MMNRKTIRFFIIWSSLSLNFVASMPLPQKDITTSGTKLSVEEISPLGQSTARQEDVEADFKDSFNTPTVRNDASSDRSATKIEGLKEEFEDYFGGSSDQSGPKIERLKKDFEENHKPAGTLWTGLGAERSSRGQSATRRQKLEAEFKECFGDDPPFEKGRPEERQTPYWSSLIKLDKYDVDSVRQICQEAYDVIPRPFSPTTLTDSTDIWLYEMLTSHLQLGPEEKGVLVHVLECEKQNVGIFYLIDGRRSTSVYFVKPIEEQGGTGPLEKVSLDENFETDLDLKTDFDKKVIDLVRARRHRGKELRKIQKQRRTTGV